MTVDEKVKPADAATLRDACEMIEDVLTRREIESL